MLSSELCQSWHGAKEKWWGFCNQYGNDNRMLFAFGPLEQPPLSLIVSLIFQKYTYHNTFNFFLFFAIFCCHIGHHRKCSLDETDHRSMPEDNPPRYQHPRISDD
jgi:hypothetical protein